MRSLPLAVPLALLAGCVAPRSPPPPPVPSAAVPRPVSPPVAAGSDWRDWPLTPGDWLYRASEFGRSDATFGPRAGGWMLQLTCDRATRRITLAVAGGPEPQPLTIRTSSALRTLPMVATTRADGLPPGSHEAVLQAADPILDAMGFSRGRFIVEQPGSRPLVVPAWPEILRVTEDCRG